MSPDSRGLVLCAALILSLSCGEEDQGVVTLRVDAPSGSTVTFTSPCSGESLRGTSADLLRGTPVEVHIENWGADGLASVFDHWEGDVPALDRYTNPLTIQVDRDLRITAVNAAGWTTETAAADFTIEDGTGIAPHEVFFDGVGACWSGACPTDDALWWTFGDGATSKDLAPTHEYKVPGIYSVTLRPLSEIGGPPPVTLHQAVVIHHPDMGSPYWYRCREFHRGLLDNLPHEDDLARDAFEEVNRRRAIAGLEEFTWDPIAATAARSDLEDRAARGWTGEISPEGWDLGQRLTLMLGHGWEETEGATATGPSTPWDIAPMATTPGMTEMDRGYMGVGVRETEDGLVRDLVVIAHHGVEVFPVSREEGEER